MPHRLLPALLVPALVWPAFREDMRMLEISPTSRAVMDGRRPEFQIRFNQPVDHGASRLEVVRAETVLQSLRPRLGASPDTLYANTGGLPAGDYVVRWTAWSARDRTGLMGDLPFNVR